MEDTKVFTVFRKPVLCISNKSGQAETPGSVIAVNNEINNHFTDAGAGSSTGFGPGNPPWWKEMWNTISSILGINWGPVQESHTPEKESFYAANRHNFSNATDQIIEGNEKFAEGVSDLPGGGFAVHSYKAMMNESPVEMGKATMSLGMDFLAGESLNGLGKVIKTQWGWTGTKIWRRLISIIDRGGTIEKLTGKVPMKEEALRLLQDAEVDMTKIRIEEPHASPNPHNYKHINYYTPSDKKGTIKIQ